MLKNTTSQSALLSLNTFGKGSEFIKAFNEDLTRHGYAEQLPQVVQENGSSNLVLCVLPEIIPYLKDDSKVKSLKLLSDQEKAILFTDTADLQQELEGGVKASAKLLSKVQAALAKVNCSDQDSDLVNLARSILKWSSKSPASFEEEILRNEIEWNTLKALKPASKAGSQHSEEILLSQGHLAREYLHRFNSEGSLSSTEKPGRDRPSALDWFAACSSPHGRKLFVEESNLAADHIAGDPYKFDKWLSLKKQIIESLTKLEEYPRALQEIDKLAKAGIILDQKNNAEDTSVLKLAKKIWQKTGDSKEQIKRNKLSLTSISKFERKELRYKAHAAAEDIRSYMSENKMSAQVLEMEQGSIWVKVSLPGSSDPTGEQKRFFENWSVRGGDYKGYKAPIKAFSDLIEAGMKSKSFSDVRETD